MLKNVLKFPFQECREKITFNVNCHFLIFLPLSAASAAGTER